MSIIQSINISIDRSLILSIDLSIYLSIDRSLNLSISQSINLSIDLLIIINKELIKHARCLAINYVNRFINYLIPISGQPTLDPPNYPLICPAHSSVSCEREPPATKRLQDLLCSTETLPCCIKTTNIFTQKGRY